MQTEATSKNMTIDDVGEDDGPPVAVEIEYETRSRLCVGITVITGYLGAGKSTLVNHLINSASGKKIAVILNEFGEEIGVERAMINEGDKGALVEEWIELANGCVCCTVKHSLVQALEQLVNMNCRLDHILIETTGLANPAPLASILWLDEQLESSVKLDSIVTVVDAKNLSFQLREHRDSSSFPEAVHQIAFADMIILNKIDLVSSTSIEQLKLEITKINSLAQIIPSVQSKVDINTILHHGAYDSKHALHLEKLLEESKPYASDVHDDGVRTLCISEIGELCVDKLRHWIEEILWEKKDGIDVYRCKGVLNVHNSDELHTLQGVREIYEIVPSRKWREEETRVSKVVFIGYNLRESFLAESFKLCVISG